MGWRGILAFTTEAQHSNILAQIPTNKAPFNSTIYFETASDRMFFVNLKQKSVEAIKLQLTDQRSNALPKYDVNQVDDGNMHFTCNLRIDVIQDRVINELETKPFQPPVPPRFSGVLTHQAFGRDDFGNAPGF